MSTQQFFFSGAVGLAIAAVVSLATVTSSEAEEVNTESYEFSEFTLERLGDVLADYENVRALLAKDAMEGLKAHCDSLEVGLKDVLGGDAGVPSELQKQLSAGVEATKALGVAEELQTARLRFGDLSEALVAIASSDSRLQQGLHIFFCPMAEGYQKWFQGAKEIENPYMGQQMITCGTSVEWEAPETPPEPTKSKPGTHVDDASHLHSDDEIAHFTCSMHPSVKEVEPGTCPICNMNLIPVTRAELETGVIMVDEVRRQIIGVRTGRVVLRPMRLEVRTVGKITYDETRLENVTLRVPGWIEELRVSETGQRVARGQTLFTVYSPDLYTAQEEYLQALRSQTEARGTGSPYRADGIVRTSKQRLLLWGLSESQIEDIGRRGVVRQSIAIKSPAAGYVIGKHVVEGDHVQAGQLLYEIAGLDQVWVEAEVYEADLPYISMGQVTNVTLPYLPGQDYEGRVTHVYPYLDEASRTGRIRVELSNPKLELRPGMFANVMIEVDLGARLQVPESAVIYTGARRLVFLDLGEGRLRPQEVELGAKGGDYYEVIKGVREGDVVVTSGNFLIAAESRIRSALEYWGGIDDE